MKKVLRFFLRFTIGLTVLILVLMVGIYTYTKTAPQFGKVPAGEELERISRSPNYRDGAFQNLVETKMGSFGDMMRTMPDFIWGENLQPKETLPVRFGENGTQTIDSTCYVTWYGHSAFLIEMDGQRILIDPMLGETAAPVSFGSKRFPYEHRIPIDELTDIDFLILSHDHYDHLDYESILALKDVVGHFVTPLGLGSHLQHWGVPVASITELDWWQEMEMNGLRFISCPARHFSGRGITDNSATEWASWVIQSPHYNIYFSGDGGYADHFQAIGKKYGPFDLAMLECGQYNQAWKAIHMMPEESVQAGIDVEARLIMPIHWGAFALSIHEWTEPIVRFKAAATEKDVPMIHPYIGERFRLGIDFPSEEWWTDVN
jgi:L-ascorbate metabolism protein UlaG (beta-lactamase superfamily)